MPRKRKPLPPPLPSSDGHPWLGVYVKDEPSDFAQFETWLGRKVDQLGVYVRQENWATDYNADWISDGVRYGCSMIFDRGPALFFRSHFHDRS